MDGQACGSGVPHDELNFTGTLQSGMLIPASQESVNNSFILQLMTVALMV